MANKENVSMTQLETISGSGKNGRVTKKDMLAYLSNRGANPAPATIVQPMKSAANGASTNSSQSTSGNVEIVEMDRMRKLIAEHMVHSKQTSAHVTSFVETDMTNIVNWRNKNKAEFQKRYGQKITFTPILIEAIVKAIKDFPMINISVDGTKLIVKKDINIGMAAALPSGNLIVPVIKNGGSTQFAWAHRIGQ